MQLLADRYQPQQSLGKKAGRQTWLARDLHTQELVVVKLLTFSHDFEWDDLKLFEREAATLRSLSHPAIPQYLDFFEFDSDDRKGFALVQTYIEAQSLEQHLKSGRTFSELEVKQLAKELLEILGYLHDRQPPVIHRDIKPSNVLLTNRSGNSAGQVYLVDFGSVQTLAARDGGTMTIVGTYGYMPPEQFGGRTTPASDLYSLGATLIYLVTGQHPADLPQDDLRLQFEHLASISPGFTLWLKWLIEPSVSKRPNSIQAALLKLERSQDCTIAPEIPVVKIKPSHSKISIVEEAGVLEITLPSPRLMLNQSVGHILTVRSIASAVCVTLCIYYLTSLFALPFLIFANLLLIPAIRVLLNFARTKVVITEPMVFFSRKLFGLNYVRPFSVKRRYLWKLALLDLGRNLRLWAGTQTFDFFGTREEMAWLAQELSDRLGLAIERE
ncbi:MAG: serine/threonine protein kinase [Phormidesmis sp. CAN_BIN44]|nr:serine/threonine protein kinase [Phormidesmis sp. CAN_BIN44]